LSAGTATGAGVFSAWELLEELLDDEECEALLLLPEADLDTAT